MRIHRAEIPRRRVRDQEELQAARHGRRTDQGRVLGLTQTRANPDADQRGRQGDGLSAARPKPGGNAVAVEPSRLVVDRLPDVPATSVHRLGSLCRQPFRGSLCGRCATTT